MKNFFKKWFGNLEFYRELISVSLPIALQMFINALVNSLDTFMVSGFGGNDATSAVSIANKYFTVFNMIMVAFAVGCSVFVAQYKGANQPEKVKKVFGISIITCLSFAIIASIIGIILKEDIFTLFTGGSSINKVCYEYGIAYLGIVVFSFIPQGLTNAITACFRSIKKPTVSLVASIFGAISNGLFNYLLINGIGFFPRLGVVGAGIATCIARVVELTILLVYYFRTKPIFYGKFRDIFTPNKELLSAVFSKSKHLVFSEFLTQAMAIFMLYVYSAIELGNSDNVAAITISQNINDIVIVFVGGMGTASSVLIGSRLGANKIEEARRNARYQISYVIIFGIIAGLTMFMLRKPIGILYNYKEEKLDLLMQIMAIQSLTFPFTIFALNIIFICRAGGYTKAPIFINNIVYYGIKFPLVLLFTFIIPNINPDLFSNTIGVFLSNIGLLPSLVIFIFIVERLCEFIRFIIGIIIYNKVGWYNNITNLA